MSTTEETRRVVEQYWSAMQTNDWRAAGELLHDEYVLEWPQSRERIRGRENFVAMNAQYPAAGLWQFDVRRFVVEGDTAVTDVLVTDSVVQGRAITFSTVRDGRIIHQLEFWPDPFEAPAWRAALVELPG
jgi:ketosteroid isomerase-like protein